MADLCAQYRSLQSEIDAAVHSVLEKGRFILGENVTLLEQETADLCGAKYGIGVNSGTDAIIIALAAAGIGHGDEVITTPFTFVATSEAIVIVGARPVYADIDPDTFNLDPAAVEKAITPKTKAILPVHLFGQCARIEELESIAQKHGLKIICDGAQAIGAARNGRKLGEMGDAATLSFFPTKNLGAYGDGGMILTNDEDIARRARSLRFHGQSSSYTYERVGFCSRLDELQAAILRVKLPHLIGWNEKRRKNASAYNSVLGGTPIKIPKIDEGNYHIYHQYTLRTPARDRLKEILAGEGVSSAVYYPEPLHIQKAYEFLGYKAGDFPASEQAAREVLSVPVYPELTEEQVSDVAVALKKAADILVSAS